jgi:sucrose-phosphate synthase
MTAWLQFCSRLAVMDATTNNAWVESYLNALLTYGLSSEYTSEPSNADTKGIDADRSLYSRYYVQSLLNLDEHALKDAWTKAVTSTRTDFGGERDTRMEYLSWRIWFLKRQMVKSLEAAALDDDTEGSDSDIEDGNAGRDGIGDAAEEPPGRPAGENGEAGNSDGSKQGPGLLPSSRGSSASSLLTSGLRKLKTKAPETESRNDIDAMVEQLMSSDGEVLAGDMSPACLMHSSENKLDRLYVVMISLHGLVRGEEMELGKDADTGGQVKYVVELAKAMSLHPAVYRVDLLTRLIQDPKVSSDYGAEEECLARGTGELGGSYIVRLPCGPTHKYVPKEQLWPYVREFADRGIVHVNSMLSKLTESGRRCDLYCIHGHYADAGECAMLMASTLGVPQITTGHSLGRNKLEHLLAAGGVTMNQIEMTYNISRRIEAEERCLDLSSMVFTSTQQEVDEQWGLYNGYDPQLAKVLHFRRAKGRHMPFMKVSPPGLDFSNLKVNIPEDPVIKEFTSRRAELAELEREGSLMSGSFVDKGLSSMGTSIGRGGVVIPGQGGVSRHASGERANANSLDEGVASLKSPSSMVEQQIHREPDIIPNRPPIWQEIAKFLRNPVKPAVLAMSRPDAKKNLTTLVKAFGEHPMLRELANLVLVMGNRDNIASMAAGSQKVLTQVLQLIDTYDLYGSVAYPKHHGQSDISDIYLYAADTRGVFVNIALQEPFGLTVIDRRHLQRRTGGHHGHAAPWRGGRPH